MGSFGTILTTLAPVLEPLLLQAWTASVLPALQAEVAKITQADELLAAQALLVALDTVAQAEIKKL